VGCRPWWPQAGTPHYLTCLDGLLTANKVAREFEFTPLRQRVLVPRDSPLSWLKSPFNARMSVGLKPTIRNIYADGDTVIIFFDASGTARDGKPYANTYAWFFDMRDGKVIKASAFFDSVEFNEFWQRVTPAASK
jgi:uncharacterized protein